MDNAAERSAAERALEVLPVLKQHAAQVDEEARFPAESVEALRESGLFGLLVPSEYGGLNGSLADLVEVAQILASGCLSTAMIWAMHSQQVDCLVRFAGEALKADLLPRIAAGKLYIGSVTTEPGAGAGLLTAEAALRDSEGVVHIDRQAPIVTGGDHADGFLITMRDTESSTSNRVTLVFAERSQLDITGAGGWNPMGMRGTHSVGLRLAGKVSDDHVVGERGMYRTVAVESMMPLAHVAWSACWLGTAKGAFADVVSLIRSPRRPKSLDPNSPLVAARLARARADLEVVSAYLQSVTAEIIDHRLHDRSLDTPPTQIHINTLKVIASELTLRAVDTLIALGGLSLGYLKESAVPLERHFRDLRSASLNFSNDKLIAVNGALSLLDRSVALLHS